MRAIAAVSTYELMTPRLRLRRWRGEDEGEMAAINRDPAVARYINRPVDERGVDAFLGFVGVAFATYLPELAARPELGWRLARSAWGRGLATEAAVAARADAFDRLGLEELIAIIHPHNERSRRIAVKPEAAPKPEAPACRESLHDE